MHPREPHALARARGLGLLGSPYRVTYEFPYTAGCFRGTPAQMQVIQGQAGDGGPPGRP